MLPHHAELVHCSISWFLYYSTGSPSATETQELLSHCLWPGVNQTCSSSWFGPTWPFPCQLDHYYILPKRKWRVIIHNIFRHLSLLPELTHRQNFVPVCCERIQTPCWCFPLWSKQKLVCFFSNLSGKDVVITNLFQYTCPGCDWIPQMSSIDNSYRKIHQLVYS